MSNNFKKRAKKTQPTHRAKYRYGTGKAATYESIGAAWFDADTGAVFVRLNGTQIVGEPFTLYPIENKEN